MVSLKKLDQKINQRIVLAQAPTHCYDVSEQTDRVQLVLRTPALLTVDGQLAMSLD